jgi:hypothetical protein
VLHISKRNCTQQHLNHDVFSVDLYDRMTVVPSREIFSLLLDNRMCQTYCVRTWLKYTVERYPKKYIVKSIRIHTNTNTIYQRRCKSW